MKSKILIGVIAIAIGLIFPAYMLLTGGSSEDVVEASIPSSEAEAVFLSLTSQLEPLSFDTSILSDARFVALVDLHTAILPEPQGRRDPFAPLGR